MKLLKILSLIAKFGAYAVVIFDIVDYAIQKVTPLVTEKTTNDDK